MRFLGNLDITKTLVIKYLLKLLKAVEQSRQSIEDQTLFTLLHYPFFDLNPLDILKLSRESHKKRTSLFSLIADPDFHKSNLVSNPGQFTEFVNLITTLNQQESSLVFFEFVQYAIEKSKLLNWVLTQKDSITHLEHLNSFIDFVKSQSQSKDLNLSSFLKLLDLMQQNNLSIDLVATEAQEKKITLTTAHKAKGLEWEYVFIINCYDTKWGNQMTRELIKLPSILKNKNLEDHDPIEDERRLFYVALTRAKKELFVTYSDAYYSFGKDKQVNPSIFITEIANNHKTIIEPKIDQKQIDDFLVTIISPNIQEPNQDEKSFLKETLKDFRLSATALNTYLECAYKFKLSNLLKVPTQKQSYFSFGTAIHSALEKFHNDLKLQAKVGTKESLVTYFTHSLSQELLTPNDFKQRLSQGKKVLSAYYDLHQKDFTPAFFVEKFFGYGFSSVFLKDVPLAGKIDRIDMIDPTQNHIKVIDYKTGNRKSRNQIEGNTKDSDGSYKRQLVFYKLLLDLDQKFPYSVIETELDFVQTPHDEKKAGKEVFKVTQKEVQELKQIILETMKKIRNLDFPRTTDFSICEHCDFKDHCWPNSVPPIASQLTLFQA